MLNTMLEALKVSLESLTDGIALMAILSNYATSSLVTSSCAIPFEKLGENGKYLAERIALKAMYIVPQHITKVSLMALTASL